RLLVLPERKVISIPVLRKVRELVLAGATVLGPRPETASGLAGFPNSDDEVKRLADELWGKGRVHTGLAAREVLLKEGIKPDFEWNCESATISEIDFIHRQTGDVEIYFVANRSTNAASVACTFRVTGKAPELWDAVSGKHHFAATYSSNEGRTT